jgi:hypothetical protein
VGAGGDKRQCGGVEHDFQGHEHEDDVAPQHQPHHAAAEQAGCQQQNMFQWYLQAVQELTSRAAR